MNSRTIFRIATAVALITGSALVSAQVQMLPSSPKLGFGASVTPAYDGWYDNPDGTHSFLIGYYNRNWSQEVDIPIGPNNRFEPGEPDRGQPTHFLPNRNYGMFIITVPKNHPPSERLWWTITLNGVTSRVGMILSAEYNMTPTRASEESPNGGYNEPPVLHFAPGGPAIKGPYATVASAAPKTATVGVPMPLELFVDDDLLYSSGANAPVSKLPAFAEAAVAKYRGPGTVKVEGFKEFTTTKGGKPFEPWAGKTNGTVTFSAPGDYIVHLTINDFSEKGGGATGCCWTTTMLKVAVK